MEKLDEANTQSGNDGDTEWQTATLAKIIQHIVRRHHAFVRKEIPRVKTLAAKVAAKHGNGHPELTEVKSIFDQVCEEFISHMLKEEQVLFPYIARMEHELGIGQELPPTFFGSVSNPIQNMMAEHDVAGEMMNRIRRLTSNYAVPQGACPSYVGLLSGLQEFEADLHQHVHLENNILFPRGLKMEEGNGGATRMAPAGSCKGQ